MTWAEKRRTMERYDQFVESYDELHYEEQIAKYIVALENVDLGSEEVIADFGCGTGIFLRLVAGFVDKAVGVDLSREELQRARDTRFDNVHLLQSDIDHPPFRYKAFDHVFSFTVLHHTENLAEEIDHLTRYSRKAIVASVLKRTDAEGDASNLSDVRGRIRRIDAHSTKDVLLVMQVESRGRV